MPSVSVACVSVNWGTTTNSLYAVRLIYSRYLKKISFKLIYKLSGFKTTIGLTQKRSPYDQIVVCGGQYISQYFKFLLLCKEHSVALLLDDRHLPPCNSNVLIISPCLPAPELPLNAHCGPDDVCADSNADCHSFSCLCNDNFFQRYSVCCECKQTYLPY